MVYGTYEGPKGPVTLSSSFMLYVERLAEDPVFELTPTDETATRDYIILDEWKGDVKL